MRYSKETFIKSSNILCDLISKSNFTDNGSARQQIESYLNYGEIEMAVEAFWIEILDGSVTVEPNNIKKLYTITLWLELNIESVFDDNIYNKILIYMKKININAV